MGFGVDISNWGGELPTRVVADWKAAGVSMVIVGVDLSGDHPMLARRQLQEAIAGGMEVEVYRFCYWASDVQTSLQLVASTIAGLPVRRVWLDFEDEDAPHYGVQPLVCGWIADCLAAAERLWPGRVGVYTARWWWDPYTGNTTQFSDRPLWAAEYDGDPSLRFTPFGGWAQPTMKQFQGSTAFCGYTVDLNCYEEDDVDQQARNDIEALKKGVGMVLGLCVKQGELIQQLIAGHGMQQAVINEHDALLEQAKTAAPPSP